MPNNSVKIGGRPLGLAEPLNAFGAIDVGQARVYLLTNVLTVSAFGSAYFRIDDQRSSCGPTVFQDSRVYDE